MESGNLATGTLQLTSRHLLPCYIVLSHLKLYCRILFFQLLVFISVVLRSSWRSCSWVQICAAQNEWKYPGWWGTLAFQISRCCKSYHRQCETISCSLGLPSEEVQLWSTWFARFGLFCWQNWKCCDIMFLWCEDYIENKKQCSWQLQCEAPSAGNVVNSSLFVNSSMSSLSSTRHATCGGGRPGGGGQGTFHPPCHILHHHIVLRPWPLRDFAQ